MVQRAINAVVSEADLYFASSLLLILFVSCTLVFQVVFTVFFSKTDVRKLCNCSYFKSTLAVKII